MLFSLACFAQVGVGTTTPNGALDVSSSTNGFVPPRVALTATNAQAPVVNPQGGVIPAGTIVWNTATAGTSPNNVAPGLYYWDGSRWVAFAGSPGGLDWSLTGNSGTTVGTNFLGTTDNQDFAINTNNIERARVLASNGHVLVNTTTNDATSGADNIFEVLATNAGNDAINGYANGAGGVGVAGYSTLTGQGTRGENSGTGIGVVGVNNSTTSGSNGLGVLGAVTDANSNGVGVQGQAVSITGTGMVALNTMGGIGIYAQTTGATNTTSSGAVYASLDQATAGNQDVAAVIGMNANRNQNPGGYAGPLAASTNSALAGVAGTAASKVTNANTEAYLFGVIGDVLRDSSVGGSTIPERTGGVLGYNGSNAWGVLGYRNSAGNTFSVYGAGQNGSIAAGNNGRMGSTDNTPNNLIGLGINGGFFGGYIKGNQYGLMSKGNEFGMYVDGNTITNKPTIQLIENNNSRAITYNTISTTVDVTTRGKSKLNNGEAFVSFNDSFRGVASSNLDNLNITITPMGPTNGVYISSVTKNGFYVKENLNGSSNASFNWVAISSVKGYEKGVEISDEILSKDFDKNMDEVMFNDNNTDGEAKPIKFDGTKVKFDKYHEPIENQKKSSERKKITVFDSK